MPTIEDEIRQKAFKSERLKALVNVLYTSYWISTLQSKIFKEHGLSLLQYNILKILRGQYPTPVNPTLIKSRIIERNSDISRVLVRMHRDKLITRTQHPDDKRQVSLLISEKGLELLAELDKRSEEMDNIVGNLSELEAQTLSLLLDKIRS